MEQGTKLMVWPEMELNGENGTGASMEGTDKTKDIRREQTELKANGGNMQIRKKVRSRQSREQNEEIRLNEQQNGGNVLCRDK
jgi:hypothetical protein